MDLAEAQRLYAEIRWGKRHYQSAPELYLTSGERKSDRRVAELGLDKIDFKGKVVWDLGCAGGFFLRYAIDQGASKAIGFDRFDVIDKLALVNEFLGYSMIELHAMDLRWDPQFTGIPVPDIVFFLSMNYHVRVPSFVLRAAPLVILEDNGRRTRDNPDTLSSYWIENFPVREYIGRSADHEHTTIYHLRKA